jgi:hypothetical protein
MPARLSEKNIRLFAAHVLPDIRALGDRDFQGFTPGRIAAAS